ncbi:MAG: thioredoxin family protein [candidate division KSB1 bacterium]|nr:thioredoxin family protein [candidate division KSB1 bacterium]
MAGDVTMISIGGMKVGLVGLSDIIEEVKAMGLTDDRELKNVILQKVKSQNYVPSSREQEYAHALLKMYKKSLGLPRNSRGLPLEEEEAEGAGLVIRVLGPGCYACDKLMEDTVAILAELGIAADVEHVRDPKEIGRYGMVGTPALVINKKVRISGRVPPRAQLKSWIEEAAKGGG